MRSILVLFALLLAANPASASVWKKNLADAMKTAKAENKLVFVDLFADWCTWCHRFEKEIVPSEDFRRATANMVLLRVDTEDRGEGAALAKRYGVSRLPTFLILTPDEVLAAKIQGFAPPAKFVAQMKSDVARWENFKKQLDSAKALPPRESLELARELVQRHDFATAEARLRPLWNDAKTPADVREEAGYLLGMAQATRGRYTEALQTLEKVLARNPSGPTAENARLQRGKIFLDQQNLAAALAEYRAFEKSFPQSAHRSAVTLYIAQIESVMARKK